MHRRNRLRVADEDGLVYHDGWMDGWMDDGWMDEPFAVFVGHLDRVVHGVVADDILSACDEKCDAAEKLSNPTVTVTQAFRRHNIATFKHLAQQHLKKVCLTLKTLSYL